jgi:predicted small lipoprotein YifL
MNTISIRTLLLSAVLAIAACGERGPKSTELKQPAGDKAGSEQQAAESPAAPSAAAPEELIWVFEARGNRQCEGGGTTLEASKGKLANARVAVHDSRCGARSDRMYPSVCGGATGDILLHQIPKNELDMALQLGFDPAEQAKYELGNCPNASS